MTEKVKVTCPKCGVESSQHQPMIVRVDNGVVSQVTLVPAWSPDERVCPGCNAVIAPVFSMELPIGWVALDQPKQEEPSRIVKPGMALPIDFNKRIRK